MKPIIPFALLGALFAVGAAQAASTTPVGYTTKALPPSQFTLVGLNVHSSVVSAGVLDAESATSVTDNEANFTTLLTAGSTYILELADGTIQEVSAWSGSVLTTPNDITALVTPGTTTYKLRKAATVSDIFGATNSAGLGDDNDGSLAGTDFLLIPNAGGAFDTVYYFNDGAGTQGWFDTQGNPADTKLLSYADGFFVQRTAGSTINLVVTGEVKTVETDAVLTTGYNYVNGVAPVGLTLGTTGLQDFLAVDSTGDIATADLVLLQQPNGTYKTTYYFNDGAGTQGWFDDQGNPADGDAVEGGLLILNRTAAKPYSINVPTSYASL